MFDYQINPSWFFNTAIDYEQLLGDVADSPLITLGGSEQNVEIELGVYYKF